MKNDVVLILSPNSIHFPVCFFTVIAIRVVATSCNPIYTVYELSNQIKDCDPKLIITVPELWHKMESFNVPTKYVSNLIRISDTISDLLAVSVTQSDVAALLYSSGTTRKSKGVILTHRNFITASLMVTADQDSYGESKHVFLCFVPMFNIMGLSVILYSQLRRGNVVVSMAKFDINKALKAMEEYRVTQLFVVPPVMIALAKQSVVNKYDLSSVKLIGSGVAPLGKELMEETAKNIPQAAIIQVVFFFFLTRRMDFIHSKHRQEWPST
ncbi:putative acid--thiol ligase [Rosa chinensis]|uniref:Putative acid--thiol ligase n=1 Tax=Rosa chinensis TaxID=74649 RepID=A0A2P6PCC9_ROSCH|nr:putative acid--thiol ligase [Rosa chinensis]